MNPSNNSFHPCARSFFAAFCIASAYCLFSPIANASQDNAEKALNTSIQTSASIEQQAAWTEESFDAITKSAQDAFENRDWSGSITKGEAALNGCLQLHSESDRRCIRLMKNNSMAYFRAEKLAQNATKIEEAYRIASRELGPTNFTTMRTREVFHQLLLDQARYKDAIPIHMKLIETEQRMGNDEFKILDGLIVLYAMYKVEGIVENEIPTLLKMTELTEALLGTDSDQLTRTVTVLAKTYCEQEQYHEFYEVRDTYQLKEKCKLPIRQRLTRLFSRR